MPSITMLNTPFGAMVGYLTLTLPLVIVLQTFSLASVDRNLIEAAWNLGCSRARTLFAVIVPSAKVGLILGGPSRERGISLNSARSVADHLEGDGVEQSDHTVPAGDGDARPAGVVSGIVDLAGVGAEGPHRFPGTCVPDSRLTAPRGGDDPLAVRRPDDGGGVVVHGLQACQRRSVAALADAQARLGVP